MAPRFTVIQGGLSEGLEPTVALHAEQAFQQVGGCWAMPARIAMGDPLRGGHARPWLPTETEGLVEQAAAEAVDRALKARLGQLRRPLRLVGAVEPDRVSRRSRPAPVARGSARPGAVPVGDLVGIRPAGWKPPATETRIATGCDAARGAVETFLALDAQRTHRSIGTGFTAASLVRLVCRFVGRCVAIPRWVRA